MKRVGKLQIGSRRPLVAALGFFACAAQALLFREHLTVFEGNELGIACFFSSWLLWVAVGALAARVGLARVRDIGDRFPLAALLYVPAFVVQFVLIREARALAGVQAYELFPLHRMLPVALLANFPVSFLTGAFFTTSCRWLSGSRFLAVADVYVWEALGGCAGGLVTTLLLWVGATSELAFACALLPVLGAVLFHSVRSGLQFRAGLCVLLAAAALTTGIDGRWARANRIRVWRRLMPTTAYRGSFATPQARYLYGRHRDQLTVVAWESVVEALPGAEHASEVVALLLAQHPGARRALVIGTGSLAICQRLALVTQIEAVTWLATDPAYSARLFEVLPSDLRQGLAKIHIPGADPRRHLRATAPAYDLIVLNLPDATTLVLNRYLTREFYQLLGQRLAPGGVVGVRVSGGENVMGTELTSLGATAYHTLKDVFAHIALKPGAETWMIASYSDRLSEFALELRARFAGISGAADVYPPDRLLSLYNPQRIAFQHTQYRAAETATTREWLLNTDNRPNALFHTLLLVLRQTGLPQAAFAFVAAFRRCGLRAIFAAALLYAVLRAVYVQRGAGIRTSREARSPAAGLPAFDCVFLVISTGAAGMALTLALMFVYQSRFGTIFLNVGLVTSLFMLGLTAGGRAAERLVTKTPAACEALLIGALSAHVLVILLLAVAGLPGADSAGWFVAAFLVCGTLSGTYVPIAAARLKSRGLSDQASGSVIELSDHVGGALGGWCAGLLLLPALGLSASLLVQALLLVTNAVVLLPHLPAARRLLRMRVPAAALGNAAGEDDRFATVARACGYGMFAAAALMCIVAGLCRTPDSHDIEPLLSVLAASELQGGNVRRRTLKRPDGTELSYYLQEDDSSQPSAYLFSTDKLVEHVNGYGGPIVFGVVADRHGILLKVQTLRSQETPAYARRVQPWQEQLRGRNLFERDPFAGVDTVTGATATARATMETLEAAGAAFARQVLGRSSPGPTERRRDAIPLARGLSLLAAGGAALMLRRSRSARLRRVFLLLSLVGLGSLLNLQYSFDHVASLATMRWGYAAWTVGLLMLAGIPLFVAVFGNIHCGYVCPFGALQELVGQLRPRRLAVAPTRGVWRQARRVKYVLLFALVCTAARYPAADVFAHDPLMTVFSTGRSVAVVLTVLAILGLAFVYPRFWCRVLCPAGAFLALLNGIPRPKRLQPDIHPHACVFGVATPAELDCIRCDRCRCRGGLDAAQVRRDQRIAFRRTRNVVFIASVVCATAVLTAATLSTSPFRAARQASRQVTTGGAGQAKMRRVDVVRLKSLVEQGELSDREALYYHPHDPVAPVAPPPD